MSKSETAEAIEGLMKENTGRHFLDSGGAYGRHWELNQKREMDKEPASTLSCRYGEINVTHNLYHWLNEKVSLDEQGCHAMKVLDRWMRIKNFRSGERSYRTEGNGMGANEMELRDAFPEFFRAWKAWDDRHDETPCSECEGDGYYFKSGPEGDYDVVCKTCGGKGWTHNISVRWDAKKECIVAEGDVYEFDTGCLGPEPTTCNSYNEENFLSQDILFSYFEMENECYVVLQVHGGCDARGGYTMPQVFTCDETAIFDYGQATVYCNKEGPFWVDMSHQPALPGVDTKNKLQDEDHYWSYSGGWGYQGSWGMGVPQAIDKYPAVQIVDETTWNDLRLEAECSEEEWKEVEVYESGKDGNFAKGWVKDHLCFVQEDTEHKNGLLKAGQGYCPCCGGQLGAAFY